MRTPHPNRRRGMRRSLLSALGATVLIGSQLVPVVHASPRPAATAPASKSNALIDPTSTVKLVVESARTEPRAFGGAGVAKGHVVTAFKWMINLDNTGTTTQRNANPGSGCSSADADTRIPASGRRSPGSRAPRPWWRKATSRPSRPAA